MPDTKAFPKGNAQVGDQVWLREAYGGVFEKDWEVSAVGLPNEHGYNLNVEIRRGEETRVVRTTRWFGSDLPHALMVPRDPPPAVAAMLREYPHLVPVRDGGNNEEERFQFFCPDCGEFLYVRQVSYETCDFRWFADDGFNSGKPSLDGGHTELVCGCEVGERREGGDPRPRTYDISFSDYWGSDVDLEDAD